MCAFDTKLSFFDFVTELIRVLTHILLAVIFSYNNQRRNGRAVWVSAIDYIYLKSCVHENHILLENMSKSLSDIYM